MHILCVQVLVSRLVMLVALSAVSVCRTKALFNIEQTERNQKHADAAKRVPPGGFGSPHLKSWCQRISADSEPSRYSLSLTRVD